MKQEENKAVCDACMQYLNAHYTDWEDDVSQDDMCSSTRILEYCKKKVPVGQSRLLNQMVEEARKRAKGQTAWRIEGTLREFPKFPAVNVWFNYPVHYFDRIGVLNDVQPDADKPSWQRAMDKRKPKEQKAKERKESIITAFEACEINEKVTVQDLAEYLGVSEKTIRNRVKEHGGFEIEGSTVRKKT